MHPTDDRAVLEARIERLERSCRRQRLGLLAAVGGAMVLGLGAWTAQESRVIEAERFVVRDAKGTIRGFFGVTSKDGVELALGAPGAKAEAHLAVHQDVGAGLQLGGVEGRPIVVLRTTDESADAQLISPSRANHLIMRGSDEVTGMQGKVGEAISVWP